MMDSPLRTKILILASNPRGTARLRLDEEVREITNGLRRAIRRDGFELIQVWAPRVEDIRRAILDIQPLIVHFCGHGEGIAGLIFENSQGEAHWVSSEALAEFFALFKEVVDCVVLNACYSEFQAEAIAKHIPYVIGMNNEINDDVARIFSVAFYDAISSGKPYEFAYKLGCNAIRMYGIPDNLVPVLKSDPSSNRGSTVDTELSRIRNRVLRATSSLELEEALYEVDFFLRGHVDHPKARMLRSQIMAALRYERHPPVMPAPARPYPSSPTQSMRRRGTWIRPFVICGFIIFLLIILAWYYYIR